MSFWAVSALINGITSSILGIIVYVKNRKNIINMSYGLFCLSIAIWSYAYFLWQISTDAIAALFWCKILMIGAIFIPICYLHHILALLGLYTQKRRIVIIAYIFGLISLALDFTPLFIKGVSAKMYFAFWPDAGAAFYPFLAIWVLIVLYGIYLIIKKLRSSAGIVRNQMRYILAATIVGWTGGATNFPLWFNIEFLPTGNILVSGYIAIVAYAIVAHRLMAVNVAITRSLAYGAITAVIAGGYVGLMAVVDRIFAGVAGYNHIVAHTLLFIAVLCALIYVLPQMKIRAIEIARRTIFRGKYDYQKELSEATRTIPTMLNLGQVGNYILNKIKDTMMVDKLSILIYDEAKHIYSLLVSSGWDEIEAAKVSLGESSSMVVLLRDNAQPLVNEELAKKSITSQKYIKEAVRQMDELGAAICIPLMLKNDLSGILALGNKKTGEMYTDEDLSLLSSLANQVALTIEYIKAVDKLSSEKRYVGLGKAAMRMAHDIKNPLVPLKTFLQMLPDKYPKEFKEMSRIDAEFTGRFYKSALDGVDRINLLIERALHYARHPQPQFSQTKLDAVLEDVLTEEAVDLKRTKVKLEKQYDSSSNSIEADSEQLMELFANLISNSVDAMEEAKEKRLVIKTEAFDGTVAVEIKDTGCGITKDKIDTIFDPFITYKHSGSGLGLAIAKKIVEDHKGIIEVSSYPDQGTTFKVILPRKQKAGG
jgi:signal transduction histidine kinase